MKTILKSLLLTAALSAFALPPAAHATDLTYTDLPQTTDSELVIQHKKAVESSSNKYAHITTQTTTAIKSGSGVIERVLVTTAGSSSTATIYDNTAGSGTAIAVINTDSLGSYDFGCRFGTGLTVVTVGTPKITVIYR